ncbi:SDR family NAD(P)-dependent oxidoreductase [Pantoea sp. DY-17]|uniref:SDR family NAD(P)-dependent oxidoreductase n=1 Tax=Pantoea sp. DY-17 TaxID=2871490 RepID=UPI001C97FCF0|nr:SDR family NAD(P)-dependent oxidoreductase [Pantoea sp. DY-17]MBY4954558.1 SDR family NAD(P)-dependent oxidoreductase [Pantoea sp. DY-17]
MTILVTGVTAGIGLAIARRFIAAGHNVIGTGRRQARLDEIRAELGERFYPIQHDVADRSSYPDILNAIPEAFSSISVLVNNAGLALGIEKAQQANAEDWVSMIDTNITGLSLLTHTFLPGMVERNRGHIINIGSVAGKYPYPGGNVYGASKAFVKQFSQNLRADLIGTDVRVTNVEPGLIGGTEFTTIRLKGDEQEAKKRYENVKALSAEDIAETVYWIATLPEHINVNAIEIMPVRQSFSALNIYRKPA